MAEKAETVEMAACLLRARATGRGASCRAAARQQPAVVAQSARAGLGQSVGPPSARWRRLISVQSKVHTYIGL